MPVVLQIIKVAERKELAATSPVAVPVLLRQGRRKSKAAVQNSGGGMPDEGRYRLRRCVTSLVECGNGISEPLRWDMVCADPLRARGDCLVIARKPVLCT